jgi:ectoine hydroxylase-related dioxygenase (phytanoyl-CoA dioxygenase family)
MFDPTTGFNLETIAADMARDGFAIIEFPDPQIDRLAHDIRQSLRPDWASWKAGAEVDMRFSEAWKVNKSVRQIATNPVIIELLSELYGRRAFPFQTLNFPVGTQQHVHADLVHFCARPPRFMCGVWVALEDIREEAGPLLYYAGSHKWRTLLPGDVGAPAASPGMPYEHYHLLEKAWEAEIAAHDAKPSYFLPKRGQALIWDANLLHGGSPQTDRSLTRHSQVTHYFFEGCSYFTPLTGASRQPIAIEAAPLGKPVKAQSSKRRKRWLSYWSDWRSRRRKIKAS